MAKQLFNDSGVTGEAALKEICHTKGIIETMGGLSDPGVIITLIENANLMESEDD